MIADLKINSMAIARDGRFIVAGMQSGRVAMFDPHGLRPQGMAHAHLGNIYGLAVHPSLPLIASLGMDNCIALSEFDKDGRIRVVERQSVRMIVPWNDSATVHRNKSQSQAIAFHPVLPRLASRGSNAGVLEFDLSGARMELLHCTRLHGLEDLTTVLYPDPESTLLISAALGSVAYSRDGLQLLRTDIGNANIHWFEPLGDGQYLIASDGRCVMRYDARAAEVLVEGPRFTRDDLEHVHLSSAGRAFVVGFDRTIYEIDPQSCAPTGTVFTAPFKMRWFKTLPDDPDTGFAQCFDGAIYRVDLRRRCLTGSWRETPPALWTACALPGGRLAFTGEGDELVEAVPVSAPDRFGLRLDELRRRAKPERGSYTKRMVADATGNLFLAQTSGAVLRFDAGGEGRELARFDTAVRDIAVDAAGDAVFLCLEEGRAHRIDAHDGSVLASWESPVAMPLWALALNEGRGLLAVGERTGRLWMLDAATLEPARDGPTTGRIKRAQWIDDDVIAYNCADSLMRYDLQSGEARVWVPAIGNTIEDFCWSPRHGYLFFVSYTAQVGMCDLETGEILYLGSDQEDYSKGLLCLHSEREDRYPLHVLTFGRRATVCGYRPHDDMLTPLGPLGPALLTHRYALAGEGALADA